MEKFKTHQSTMAVLFTAAGKTVIFSNIIGKFLPGRVLVIVGADSLIWQAKRSIEHWAKVKCGVEMAGYKADPKQDQVVLATWQTLISGGKAPKEGALFDTPSKRRMNRFKPADFDLVVIDEFHHAAAPSYRVILDYFKLNPKIKILGVTATPKRGDGLALGEVCESTAFEMHILQGAENGWLVDVVQHEYKVGGLDYSHLKITKGDFDAPELKSLLEKQETVAGMCHPILEVMFGLKKHTLNTIEVSKWRDYLAGLNRKPRKTLLFTVSVAQAEMACDIMNRIVPDIAGWVCGKHNKDTRKEIFDAFELGQTSLLANVGITIEGYDHPKVEVIAMGRPTLSIATYIQMVGRGTRVLPGIVDTLTNKDDRLTAIANSAKPRVRVIDFKGNCGRHNLVTVFDVLGGRASEKAERAKKRAAKSDAPKSVLKTLSIAEAEIEKEKRAEEERRKEVSRKRVNELVPKAHYQVNEVSPFKNHGSNRPMPTESRNEKPFSPGQRKMLLQWGFPIEKITYRQGQGVIGRAVKNGWKPVAGDKAWAIALNKSNPHNYKPKTDHEHAKHDYQLYLEKITA